MMVVRGWSRLASCCTCVGSPNALAVGVYACWWTCSAFMKPAESQSASNGSMLGWWVASIAPPATFHPRPPPSVFVSYIVSILKDTVPLPSCSGTVIAGLGTWQLQLDCIFVYRCKLVNSSGLTSLQVGQLGNHITGAARCDRRVRLRGLHPKLEVLDKLVPASQTVVEAALTLERVASN